MQIVMPSDECLDPAVLQLQVVVQWLDGFVFLEQLGKIFEAGAPLLGPSDVDVYTRESHQKSMKRL